MKKQKLLFSKFLFRATFVLLSSLCFGFTIFSNPPTSDLNSRTVSFDDGWRFIKDSLSGAENPDFNDSGWRILDLPHDWSIEDLPGQNGENIIGPFDKSSADKMSSGYLIGGTGWYRKTFTVKEEDRNKVNYLQFDGVYMNTDVWLNGKHLGFHPYGYTPFYYDFIPQTCRTGKCCSSACQKYRIKFPLVLRIRYKPACMANKRKSCSYRGIRRSVHCNSGNFRKFC